MPNDTRSGLKISGNGSDGGMNPPQSPDLNITEAVWDPVDRGVKLPFSFQVLRRETIQTKLKYEWNHLYPFTADSGFRQ